MEVKRWKYYLGWAMSLFVILGLGSNAMAKLMMAPMIIDGLAKVGLQDSVLIIGIIELSCIVLYLVPQTSKFGFYLLCSFIGGVIVTQWISGDSPTMGIVMAVLLYLGTMLRRPEMSDFSIEK